MRGLRIPPAPLPFRRRASTSCGHARLVRWRVGGVASPSPNGLWTRRVERVRERDTPKSRPLRRVVTQSCPQPDTPALSCENGHKPGVVPTLSTGRSGQPAGRRPAIPTLSTGSSRRPAWLPGSRRLASPRTGLRGCARRLCLRTRHRRLPQRVERMFDTLSTGGDAAYGCDGRSRSGPPPPGARRRRRPGAGCRPVAVRPPAPAGPHRRAVGARRHAREQGRDRGRRRGPAARRLLPSGAPDRLRVHPRPLRPR